MKDWIKEYCPIVQKLVDLELMYELGKCTPIEHEEPNDNEIGGEARFKMEPMKIEYIYEEYDNKDDQEKAAKIAYSRLEQQVVTKLLENAQVCKREDAERTLHDNKYYSEHVEFPELRIRLSAIPSAVKLLHICQCIETDGVKHRIVIGIPCIVYKDYYGNVGIVKWSA